MQLVRRVHREGARGLNSPRAAVYRQLPHFASALLYGGVEGRMRDAGMTDVLMIQRNRGPEPGRHRDRIG
jgi:hypothetical protein